jgi:peptidyl-dipeptidase A
MRPLFCLALIFAAGISAQTSVKPAAAPAKGPAKPTIADARTWIEKAEKRLLTLGIDAGRADWIASTYIIEDSEILSAQLNQRAISATVALVKEADRFNGVPLPEDIERKIKLLKLSLTLPAPSNEAEAEELTRIKSAMEGMYGKGKYCPPTAPKGDDNKDGCLDI